MKPLRLVIVTRRFWPLVGGPERLLANLAVELAGRGCAVTVLTPRWRAAWPTQIRFHGVPVTRLPHAPEGRWGMLRHLRLLARWLRAHAARYDLVYVSTLRHEAYVALRAAGAGTTVVVRAERAGRRGDCAWQAEATCGTRIKRRCMTAAALVAPSPAVEQELIAAGYPAAHIRYVPNGVPIPPPRTPAAKAVARAVLGEAHAALNLPDDAPLAVYTGRLSHDKGLKPLVIAWRQVLARWPSARLWLAGEGSEQTALQRQIEVLNLSGRVLLAGVFDTVDELLAAADLFVAPSLEVGTAVSLMEAMAAGLPIVAADTAGHRPWITDGQHGLLVPGDDACALAAAIQRLLDEPELAARLGAAAHRRAAEFSLARMADQHLALFESLRSAKV